MEISRLAVIVVLRIGAWLFDHLRQAPQPEHPQDVDIVLAAESLQESKMNLKSDVVLILLVRGQHAQHHAVWIAVIEETINQLSPLSLIANTFQKGCRTV